MRVKLGLEHTISAGYKDDSVLSKVLNKPEHYLMFKVRNDLIYMDKRGGEEVLCIPHTKFKGDMIVAMVIVQAHQALGHLGAQRTVDYICRWYWWPKLGQEVDKYYRSCPVCQATKTDNQRPKASYTACQYQPSHGGQSQWTSSVHSPQARDLTTCGSCYAGSRQWYTWYRST